LSGGFWPVSLPLFQGVLDFLLDREGPALHHRRSGNRPVMILR